MSLFFLFFEFVGIRRFWLRNFLSQFVVDLRASQGVNAAFRCSLAQHHEGLDSCGRVRHAAKASHFECAEAARGLRQQAHDSASGEMSREITSSRSVYVYRLPVESDL